VRLTAYLLTMNHILLDDMNLIRAKNFSVTGSNLLCLMMPVIFMSVAKVTKIVRHITNSPDVQPPDRVQCFLRIGDSDHV
jgi:hypothetical protein